MKLLENRIFFLAIKGLSMLIIVLIHLNSNVHSMEYTWAVWVIL